jgi:hypothetical protein
LSDSIGENVKNSILNNLKAFCEDLMGIKRVDENFLKQTIYDIACDKYIVALDTYTIEESEEIY